MQIELTPFVKVNEEWTYLTDLCLEDEMFIVIGREVELLWGMTDKEIEFIRTNLAMELAKIELEYDLSNTQTHVLPQSRLAIKLRPLSIETPSEDTSLWN